MRFNGQQIAFNTGEIDLFTEARVDLSKYQGAVSRLRNWDMLTQGSIRRRPGSRFVAEAAPATEHHLLTFAFSALDQHVLEVTPWLFRFFRDGAQTVVDVDAPLSVWLVDRGNAVQASGVWTLTGPGAAIHATIATEAGREYVIAMEFGGLRVKDNQAFDVRIGTSLGAIDLGGGQRATGRHLFGFTATSTIAYVQIAYEGTRPRTLLSSTVLPPGPLELTTPFPAPLCLKTAQSADVLYIVCPIVGLWALKRYGLTSWSLERVDLIDGPYEKENQTTTTLDAAAGTGDDVLVTASSKVGINDGRGFEAGDVGRLLRIENTASTQWGWATIRTVVDALNVRVDIERQFTAAATTKWALGLAGTRNDVSFHEQRLVIVGQAGLPFVAASQSGVFDDFTPDSLVESTITVEDDDAYTFFLADAEVNQPRWVLSTGTALVVGTSGSEYFGAAQNGVLTPLDGTFRSYSAHGSANIKAVRAGPYVLFVDVSGRTVRQIRYEFGDDTYKADDIGLLATHIFERTTVRTMTYQRRPQQTAVLVLEDGRMARLAYSPEAQVLGWGVWETEGAYKSAAVINVAGAQELWVVVERAGGTFVEVFAQQPLLVARYDHPTTAAWRDAVVAEQCNVFCVDSGITVTTGETTIGGLAHLAGQTVEVLVDGAAHPSREVDGQGNLTLDWSGAVVHVGLGYRSWLWTARSREGVQSGIGLADHGRIHEVALTGAGMSRVRVGPDNEELFDATEFGDTDTWLDATQPLATRDVNVAIGTLFTSDPRVYLEVTGPSTFTLMAMTYRLQREPR